MAKSAMKLLNDKKRLEDMKAELSKVKDLLGTAGASRRVAERVLQMK
jgi:hypothetical protein